MRTQRTCGLGLALATILSVTLTAWLMRAAPAADPRKPSPRPVWREAAAAQEPPPAKSLWDRASSLFQKRGQDAQRLALRQSAQRLGVADWHRAGWRGTGIKVAILDSGFKGYTQALGKALPARVQVRSFRKDGRLEARDSQHGILCGEVIHHLAPGAELLLANWEPETPSAFLDAVRWARQQGAHLISCSVIMPTWSDGEGHGAAHRAIREALGSGDRAGDGLFVASAGNTALRHWGGQVNPGKDGWHQWVRATCDNALRPLAVERISVELTSPETDCYEVVVRDTVRDAEIGRARSQRIQGVNAAAVRFEPQPGQRYAVRVRSLQPTRGKGGRFHLTILGGKLQYATRQGSIPFPADGAEVIAVGALDEKGKRQSYSSCGPCLSGPKPDLSAVVPFPSVWRPEQPFSGTSAAAPQAAALAALIWSRHPDWTASQVRRELCRAAGGGHSVECGFGTLRLPRLKK